MVVAELEEVGQPLHAEFLGLVGTPSHAVSAGAHGKAADFDAARSQFDAVRGLFGRRCREKVVRKIVQGGESGRAADEEVSTVHGHYDTRDEGGFAGVARSETLSADLKTRMVFRLVAIRPGRRSDHIAKHLPARQELVSPSTVSRTRGLLLDGISFPYRGLVGPQTFHFGISRDESCSIVLLAFGSCLAAVGWLLLGASACNGSQAR